MRSLLKKQWLIGTGIALIVGVWMFRDSLRNRIAQDATLSNPAPPAEVVGDMIEQAPDRTGAIMATWNTGRIVQREVAVHEIGNSFPPDQPLPGELEAILLAGALDADLNVRETALSTLSNRHHPALPALAGAQLRDCDPQVRLLGLNYLKQFDAPFGVPAVIPLLDESDPLIVATALKCLEHWTDQKFGVKLADTAPRENETTGLIEYQTGSQAKALAGAQQAKIWWTQHQKEFSPAQTSASPNVRPIPKLEPAADFSLRTLDGRKIRLADFRGKVVLLNFWTTWCSACVAEMPELIALQKQHGNRLAIIGVSLDFVPDEDGDIGGHAAVEEQSHSTTANERHEPGRATLDQVRKKVARTLLVRGINYPILLDEANEVGGSFNGGELPTTVIVDAEGNVRRRFVGARSLPVFEAMIAEASQPVSAR